jgi:hypothetical protein
VREEEWRVEERAARGRKSGAWKEERRAGENKAHEHSVAVGWRAREIFIVRARASAESFWRGIAQ